MIFRDSLVIDTRTTCPECSDEEINFTQVHTHTDMWKYTHKYTLRHRKKCTQKYMDKFTYVIIDSLTKHRLSIRSLLLLGSNTWCLHYTQCNFYITTHIINLYQDLIVTIYANNLKLSYSVFVNDIKYVESIVTKRDTTFQHWKWKYNKNFKSCMFRLPNFYE